MKEIVLCPKCKKPVEAKDYFNPGIIGFLESVLPNIDHDCGYRGLPISLRVEDYKKLKEQDK